MIDCIRSFLKSITGEINTPNAIWRIGCTAVGYVSSFFTSATLLKDLTGFDKLEIWVKGHWGLLVIASLLISCVLNRRKINCCKRVVDSDVQIAISVRDIFDNSSAGSYIIPTNTFFRTKMAGEYISPNSVQGRFQLKYFKRDEQYLDRLIAESLNEQRIKGEQASDCFGKTIKYQIGTVAKVDYKKKHFYFVALNDVNRYGKPIGQSIANVDRALSAVTDAIKQIGHCDTLCIPLLGSGKAAIQEATKENVFLRTVDHFVQSDDKLVSKLIIAISPKDYVDGKIDLARMEKYLDYRCEFGKEVSSVL